MSGGVTGRLDHARLDIAELHESAFRDGEIERADARGLLGRADDAKVRKRRLEAGPALDVIGMMVRDPQIGQRPALRARGGDDGVGVGGVDRRGRARARIMDEDAVIVLEARELKYVGRHGVSPAGGEQRA